MLLRNRPRSLESIFLAFLSVSQVYYGYRWLLKYDSTSTSPTYADTPMAFQVVKYVLAVVFFGASLAVIVASGGRSRRVDNSVLFFLMLVCGFVAYSFALGLTFLSGNDASIGDILVFRGFFFFPMIALLPFHYAGEASLKRYLGIVLSFGCVYHVLYSAIQIVAYLGFGRLPALAYEGGLVRFGGGWDDPNSFGGFLSLPLLFILSDAFFRSSTRFLLAVVLLTLLGLTVSLAGIGGFICAALFYAILRARILTIISVSMVVVGVISNSTVWDLLVLLYERKQKSLESHLTTMSVLDFLSDANLVEILFGQHGLRVITNESFYVALAENYGFVGLVWFACILILTLGNAVLKAGAFESHGDHRRAELMRVLVSFIVGMSVASTGIAFYYDFPLNLYLWLAIFLIWLVPGVNRQRAVAPAVPAAPATNLTREIS